MGKSRIAALAALVACTGVTACSQTGGPRLEKVDPGDVGVPQVPVPPEGGPRLGAIADRTPVFDRPSKRGVELGALHAGATVVRAAEPYTTRGCEGGWFPIRPRGFVCAAGGATTDLGHPTLIAMATQPSLDAPLPYTYARAVRDTTLFEPDPEHDDLARPTGPLRARSGAAIVGSWTAKDPSGKSMRLAMMTDGHFLPAEDLEAITGSTFHGVELGDGSRGAGGIHGETHALPVAFVVKRGVHSWSLGDETPEKRAPLGYHACLALTGRFRTLGGVEFWATRDGSWVRLRDVTLVRERGEFPPFATPGRRWLDLSTITESLVLYEGTTPVYATLVSVDREPPPATAEDGPARGTRRGEFEVLSKQVTALGRDPSGFAENVSIYDAPWVLELSSGQLLVGAYWHDRFGIEHGTGNVELSPADAARVFRFVTPDLPGGWHAVSRSADDQPAIVDIRR